VDDPGTRKLHETPIPLAGGLAVMTGMAVPTLLASLWLWIDAGKHNSAPSSGRPGLLDPTSEHLLSYGLSRRGVELAGILLGALGMLIVGYLDDKHELRPRAKFVGQLLSAAVVAACGARITLFVPSVVFSYAITITWILTLINAFNFMDNMNGLCGGLGVIGAAYFGLIAAADGEYLVASIAFLTLGALLGFLPYNFPNARAFLGDAGSHLVGFLLAVLAILPHFYSRRHPRPWAVLVPLFVLALPLCDMVWVVIIRWRLGQPFYQGDNNHLSHRLVRRGLSRKAAVMVIWLLAVIVGALAWLC
jgi:UDP-GlcNAc:undecaprenyl-phosphate GlcNAc-1-phosphate transferase